MKWLDVLGLLTEVVALAQTLRGYGQVPIKWSKRIKGDRWELEGTLRRKPITGPLPISPE